MLKSGDAGKALKIADAGDYKELPYTGNLFIQFNDHDIAEKFIDLVLRMKPENE